jgi:Antitoxin VbhA
MRRFSGSVSVIPYGKPNPLISKRQGGLPKFLNFAQEKPVISPAEVERRKKHVAAAIADSRIEGYPPPSGLEQDILDAYIRGEIEAEDLVEVYKRRQQQYGALEDGLK